MLWASDFTFISYKGEFVYLCTVIDAFTGEVLGFNYDYLLDSTEVLGFSTLSINLGDYVLNERHCRTRSGTDFLLRTFEHVYSPMDRVLDLHPTFFF